jgi:PilZ domain
MPSMDSTPAPPGPANRRPASAYLPRAPRKRTCLSGKLVYSGGSYSLDCAVRDLSEGGAKITLEKRQALPLDLHLIVVKYCVAYQARVVWMNFPARGLQFSRTFRLSTTLPSELKHLQQLWVDVCARSGQHAAIAQWAAEQAAALSGSSF